MGEQYFSYRTGHYSQNEGLSLVFVDDLIAALACRARNVSTVRHFPIGISGITQPSSFTIALNNVSGPIASKKSSCGETGATDIMLNNPKAFHSFCRYHKECAVLGDKTRVPIVGRGITVFNLNGFIIKVWNALYVPSFCDPLYFLNHHIMMLDAVRSATMTMGRSFYFLISASRGR